MFMGGNMRPDIAVETKNWFKEWMLLIVLSFLITPTKELRFAHTWWMPVSVLIPIHWLDRCIPTVSHYFTFSYITCSYFSCNIENNQDVSLPAFFFGLVKRCNLGNRLKFWFFDLQRFFKDPRNTFKIVLSVYKKN